jgi:hypothetical protein
MARQALYSERQMFLVPSKKEKIFRPRSPRGVFRSGVHNGIRNTADCLARLTLCIDYSSGASGNDHTRAGPGSVQYRDTGPMDIPCIAWCISAPTTDDPKIIELHRMSKYY